MTGPELIPVATDGPVRAVFTTRRGGVSTGSFAGLNLGTTSGDQPEDVRRNRAVVCDVLGLDPGRVTMGHQVHGARVRAIDAPTSPGRFLGELSGWPEGDGLATSRPGLPLVVLGADCLPVLLWRRDTPHVAAAHAGWRGLVGGVLEAAVGALGSPAQVAAAIGPGIGPDRFEVGEDVQAVFRERLGPETVRGRCADLALGARIALRRAGVADAAITTVAACTHSEPERFYSYRRDGAATGRQAGIIWIVDEAVGE